MKKILLISCALTGLFQSASFAQCCNVIASNGTAVSTTNGVCISLTYPTSDCLMAAAPASDIDGDGLPDASDRCPGVKGPLSNEGCPEIVVVEIWSLFYSQLKDVKFAYDSDSLTPTSFSKLDKVALLMKEHNGHVLKVSGYADSVGTDAYNKTLSQKRALAVKNYLHRKGVPDNKVIVAGYGEKFPKAPNETASGRSANRRVEFDIVK